MAGMGGTPFSSVFWLGGAPCAGKSTVAKRIGALKDIQVYHIDEQFDAHRPRFNSVKHPHIFPWLDPDWDALWMRPVAVLLEEVIAAYSEHFSLVLEDLQARKDESPLIVEGNPCMPHLIVPLLETSAGAAWVVPEESFLRRQYRRRGGWVDGILSNCRDPEAAYQNWIDRDAAFADWVRQEAQSRVQPVFITSQLSPIEETYAWVSRAVESAFNRK